MKKLLSMILILTIILSVSTDYSMAESLTANMVLINSEVITVNDDQGNSVEIEVKEYREFEEKIYNYNNELSVKSITPEYPIGTQRVWTFKISNAALGIPGVVQGAPLSSVAKKKLADLLVKAVGQKIGGALVPGISWAMWGATAIAGINQALGNNGFEITVEGEYKATYIHSQGHYMYGWSLSLQSIEGY